MRNSINSSVANVIRRYRATAVGMLCMDSPSIQWHATVKPTCNAHQSSYSGLLTSVVAEEINRFDSIKSSLAEFLSGAIERLFLETTFGNQQQCPEMVGNSGTGRVS